MPARIWTLDLHSLDALDSELQTCLSSEERDRRDRYVIDRPALEFSRCRACLRLLLAAACDCRVDDIRFTLGEHGKPQVAGGPHFNVSHSHGRALLAISDQTIGVDIEHHRAVRDLPRLASRYFSQIEQSELPASQELTEAFYAIWTRKEAVVKAHGQGISLGLHDFSVPPYGADQGQVRSDTLVELTGLTVAALRQEGEFSAAWAGPSQQISVHELTTALVQCALKDPSALDME